MYLLQPATCLDAKTTAALCLCAAHAVMLTAELGGAITITIPVIIPIIIITIPIIISTSLCYISSWATNYIIITITIPLSSSLSSSPSPT